MTRVGVPRHTKRDSPGVVGEATNHANPGQKVNHRATSEMEATWTSFSA